MRLSTGKNNERTKIKKIKNSDQKLETTSGLTFIWPQDCWMVGCNIGSCQYIAYSYTLKPVPRVFTNPTFAICKLTFITEARLCIVG